MKAMYSDLFKKIVKAYYEGDFERKLEQIIADTTIDKHDLCEVISSLCGVRVDIHDNCENYIDDLKKAIKNYKTDERIYKVVDKVMDCKMDCIDEHGKTRCQKSCPFDAIFTDKEKHRSFIVNDKCTDCGFCVEACKAGKILDKVEFIPLADLLKQKVPVIAVVAPAIIGQFSGNVTLDKLRCALKKAGFKDMVEVAFFADMLTLKEADEFNAHVNKEGDFMITSCCCPMWMGMLKGVYNNLIKHVSPSVSPMIAAGRVMKKLEPECKVVFIGPCIAKKAEAKDKDLLNAIDYVLTFAELKDIFEVLSINPAECNEDNSTEYASKGGRLYARTGGISIAVSDAVQRLYPEKFKLLKAAQANGIKQCKEMLSSIKNGEIPANFLEGMGCTGGCVGGPKALIPMEEGKARVDEFANASEIKVAVDSECMKLVLNKLNINSDKDFEDSKKSEVFQRNF